MLYVLEIKMNEYVYPSCRHLQLTFADKELQIGCDFLRQKIRRISNVLMLDVQI